MNKLELDDLLVCPYCKFNLIKKNNNYVCSVCNKTFPNINQKPSFIESSNFNSDKILNFFISKMKWIIPSPSFNFVAKKNILFLKKQLKILNEPKILIIGGGSKKYGKGLIYLSQYLKKSINLEVIDGPLVNVIGDAHNLPFKKNSFDLVIIQAVLEHVEDPIKIINEIFFVLKKGGFLYIEVPLIQGIHGRPFDYQRYTEEGLSILCKNYKKIKSGMVVGPTSALIWILREYLSVLFSFNLKYLYYLFNLIFGWLLFPFKFIDYFLIRLKYSSNIAGGFFYIAKK